MKKIDIKGKDYIPVHERIKFFREKFSGWTMTSEIEKMEDGYVIIKATIENETGKVVSTAYAHEKEGSSFINKTSYIENCETSAWGRALGNLGIGIDTSIASAEEVMNAQLQQKEKTGLHVKETYETYFDSIKKDLMAATTSEGLVKAWEDNKQKISYLKNNAEDLYNEIEYIKDGRKDYLSENMDS